MPASAACSASGSAREIGDVARAGRDRGGVPARQVVEHDDVVAGLQQLLGDDGADVAGAARDEGPHAAEHSSRDAREPPGPDGPGHYNGRVRARLLPALLAAFALLAAPAAAQVPTPTPTPTPTATPSPEPTATPEPTPERSDEVKAIYRDYRRDGELDACKHEKADLKEALKDLTDEDDAENPDLRYLLEAGIDEHKSGDCARKAEQEAQEQAQEDANTGTGTGTTGTGTTGTDHADTR